ncbi:hypothetical protein FKW77_002194 [Venturia effusa]|uniref:Uncharacterized protein n=1 Tax=Venturia effusa TaxID=50376 RepID=A0A517LGM9_9PEZI|nr:hypothetical protein FKW77_002194 [Venturia effusa]
MACTLIAAAGADSDLLALSKAAWKIGFAITALDHETGVDETLKKLADEARSFSTVCDSVHTELNEVEGKIEAVTPAPYSIGGRIWDCLTIEAQESRQLLNEMELFMQSLRERETSSAGRPEWHKNKPEVADFVSQVSRRAENFRTTLLLIKLVLALIPPRQADCKINELQEQLKAAVEIQQRFLEAAPQVRRSFTDSNLLCCIIDFIGEDALSSKRRLDPGSATQERAVTMRVVEWKTILDTIREEQQGARKSVGADEDDFDVGLAEAALRSGVEAFDKQDWYEASALLQDALRLLRNLSAEQRAFCDPNRLDYKLTLCAFHTQEPADAEEALTGLVKVSAATDEHKKNAFDAIHLLSILHIRGGNIDHAEAECDKVLRGRWALLGKANDLTIESLALMAHIYALQKDSRRAKQYTAMIPESKREAVTKAVERQLGMTVDFPAASSGSTSMICGEPDQASYQLHGSSSDNPIDRCLEGHHRGIGIVLAPPRSSTGLQQAYRRFPSPGLGSEGTGSASSAKSESLTGSLNFSPQPPPWTEKLDPQSAPLLSLTPADERPGFGMRVDDEKYSTAASTFPSSTYSPLPIPASSHWGEEDDRSIEARSIVSDARMSKKMFDNRSGGNEMDSLPGPPQDVPMTRSPVGAIKPDTVERRGLSRREILDRIGCLPRDEIEDAVCDANQVAFSKLLKKRTGFWRTRLRERVRPERVTALHFAALFGEIEMARRLIDSKFSVNEIPWGYTTIYTPLKFAIGARQVAMVEFLIGKGAKPTVPESWSSLAGQLMNRSWLQKTMSENDRDKVSGQMMAILRILLNHGLDVDAPIDNSGTTLLHQAVTFGTSQRKPDLNLSIVVTSFLCDKGASPFQMNAEGKSPYDMAESSDRQELMAIFGRGSGISELAAHVKQPVELSC